MKKSISILLAVMMLFALATTAFADEGPSPSPEAEVPPVLNKEATGAGVTEHNEIITVKEWKAEDTDFVDAKAAVEAALASDAFKALELDPTDFTGSLVASVSLDGSDTSGTLVILYKDDEPDTALYFYNDEWIKAEIEPSGDLEHEYTVTFEATEEGKGFNGEVVINIEDKDE